MTPRCILKKPISPQYVPQLLRITQYLQGTHSQRLGLKQPSACVPVLPQPLAGAAEAAGSRALRSLEAVLALLLAPAHHLHIVVDLAGV